MRNQISTWMGRMSRMGRMGQIGLLAGTLLAGCATGPIVKADGSGASLAIDVSNDHHGRPGSLRLAAADYTIDGVPVLSMRTQGTSATDVPDEGKWAGAVSPGEHVLEATLSYPPRAAQSGPDMAFAVRERFRFNSRRGDVVRIHVTEAIDDNALSASLDNRLGIRFVRYQCLDTVKMIGSWTRSWT